jgi:hypothetical protein
MARRDIGALKFAKVYPFLVAKAERKGRTKEEVDEVTCWLTGYDAQGLEDQIARETDYATFFAEAPRLHPNASQITGTICGYRIEDIEDPVERKVRYLDKLVDELAKGRPMEKIKRG